MPPSLLVVYSLTFEILLPRWIYWQYKYLFEHLNRDGSRRFTKSKNAPIAHGGDAFCLGNIRAQSEAYFKLMQHQEN